MLVGRGAQLDRLAAALGADRPVAVTGEAGIGKTALLRAAAGATGRAVFAGGALSTLSWLRYLALERALGRPVTGDDPAAVAADVEAVVAEGVLLLDDLQWAAAPTLDAVSFLAGRIGLLAGVRGGGDPALDRLRDAGFEVVELERLVESEAVDLVRRLCPDLGPNAAARVAARAGGNPLLLRELAATGEPSASLQLALRARLRRLDLAGREAFGMLALVGRPVAVDVLGSAGAKSLLAADLAVKAGPDTVEIRHALLGEVAVADLDDDERRRLHATLARAVEDPGEAARHHALAGERVTAREKALLAAAGSARPGERASHLAVAASSADGPQADSLRLQAAWALEDAHDWPALRALLDELAAGPPEVRAEAALVRARASWRAGDPEGLRAAIATGLELVGGTGSQVETRLIIERSRIPIFLDDDPAAAVRATTAALELARRTGIDVPRAEYLHGTALYVAHHPGTDGALRQAVDAARVSDDVGTEMLAANNLVAWHEMNGDPALARDVAQEFVERSRELGLGVWERSFRIALSNLAFHAGDYMHVLAVADELLDLPLETRTREALVEQLCLALIDLGRIDEALRRIDAVPERPHDWTLKRQVAWVRCEAALWGGRPEQAVALSDEILAGPESDDNIPFAHVSRAWALLGLQRDPRPQPLQTEGYPAMLAAVPSELEGVGLLHAARPAEAVPAFDRAAELWSPYHRRGALRCRWAAGEAARRAGAADAVDRLLEVEAEVGAHGMLPLLARVHRSLRAAGIHRATPRQPRGAGLLTGREREVLRLVATGLTNAEIARRLGLSRHTVVSQIAAASLKLGASSRSQAAALADAS